MMKKIGFTMISAFPVGDALAHESLAAHQHLAEGVVSFQSALTPVLWLGVIGGVFLLLRWLVK